MYNVVYVRNINDLHLNVMPHVKISKGSHIVKYEDNDLSTFQIQIKITSKYIVRSHVINCLVCFEIVSP